MCGLEDMIILFSIRNFQQLFVRVGLPKAQNYNGIENMGLAILYRCSIFRFICRGGWKKHSRGFGNYLKGRRH